MDMETMRRLNRQQVARNDNGIRPINGIRNGTMTRRDPDDMTPHQSVMISDIISLIQWLVRILIFLATHAAKVKHVDITRSGNKSDHVTTLPPLPLPSPLGKIPITLIDAEQS
jgi:hypothetical protein